MTETNPGPGWHPDPVGQYQVRYHDGTGWTEHVSTDGQQSTHAMPPTGSTPLPGVYAAPAAARAAEPSPSAAGGVRSGRPWWHWALAAFVVLGIIGALIPEDKKNDKPARTASAPVADTANQARTPPATGASEPAPAAEPAPTPTVAVDWKGPEETTRDKVTLRGTVTYGAHVKVNGQRAAITGGTNWSKVVRVKEHGENVYSVKATKEGYDSDDLEASVTRKLSAAEKAAIRQREAARRAGARALASAKSYLSHSAFSKQGLYEQLSSEAGEGFTESEARYAVDHVGADWKEQAVKSARSYLSHSSFSREGLIEQLSSQAGEGFTYEEAVYAVDKVY